MSEDSTIDSSPQYDFSVSVCNPGKKFITMILNTSSFHWFDSMAKGGMSRARSIHELTSVHWHHWPHPHILARLQGVV